MFHSTDSLHSSQELERQVQILLIELSIRDQKIAERDCEIAELTRNHEEILEMFVPPWRE